MNNKGMFYTNVSDYETKEDMMNDFIALRMYDMAKDKEIERLKEEYVMLQNASDEVEEELQQRIDKAIEYIEEQSKFIEGCDIYRICNKDVLLDILKGVDKE